MSREIEYDPASLRDSIKHARKSIKNYEAAIQNQESLIADYRKMIETLEIKKKVAEGIAIDAHVID
jgi:hypothetical protein